MRGGAAVPRSMKRRHTHSLLQTPLSHILTHAKKTYSEEIAMEMRPSSQRRPYAFSMQQQHQHSPTSLPYLVQGSKTTQRANGHGSLPASSASAPSSVPSSASSTTRSRTLGERPLAWGSASTPSSTATTLRHSAWRHQQERVEFSSSSEDEEETEEELGSSAHRRAKTTPR